MPPVITSLILATTVVATLAVGVAGASFVNSVNTGAAPKSDRLPVATADADGTYITFETRADANTSVLHKIQVN